MCIYEYQLLTRACHQNKHLTDTNWCKSVHALECLQYLTNTCTDVKQHTCMYLNVLSTNFWQILPSYRTYLAHVCIFDLACSDQIFTKVTAGFHSFWRDINMIKSRLPLFPASAIRICGVRQNLALLSVNPFVSVTGLAHIQL